MIFAASTADSLLRVLYTSVAASIAVAVAFSLTVLGAIRASEMRRADRRAGASAYATLATAGGLAFAAIVVYGVVLLTQKS